LKTKKGTRNKSIGGSIKDGKQKQKNHDRWGHVEVKLREDHPRGERKNQPRNLPYTQPSQSQLRTTVKGSSQKTIPKGKGKCDVGGKKGKKKFPDHQPTRLNREGERKIRRRIEREIPHCSTSKLNIRTPRHTCTIQIEGVKEKNEPGT